MKRLSSRDRTLAEDFAGPAPFKPATQAELLRSDLAYARMKASGELQRIEATRAHQREVQINHVQGLT